MKRIDIYYVIAGVLRIIEKVGSTESEFIRMLQLGMLQVPAAY